MEEESDNVKIKDAIRNFPPAEDPRIAALKIKISEALKTGKPISQGVVPSVIDTSKMSAEELKTYLDSLGPKLTKKEIDDKTENAFKDIE